MYDDQMDIEVINLCDALNCIPGIKTSESCSGHGKYPLSVFFTAIDQEGLFFLTRCTDSRYWRYGNDWKITLSVGDTITEGRLPTNFILESKTLGDLAYLQAEDLIENMIYHLNHKNFVKGFNLNLDRFKVRKINESYMFNV